MAVKIDRKPSRKESLASFAVIVDRREWEEKLYSTRPSMEVDDERGMPGFGIKICCLKSMVRPLCIVRRHAMMYQQIKLPEKEEIRSGFGPPPPPTRLLLKIPFSRPSDVSRWRVINSNFCSVTSAPGCGRDTKFGFEMCLD